MCSCRFVLHLHCKPFWLLLKSSSTMPGEYLKPEGYRVEKKKNSRIQGVNQAHGYHPLLHTQTCHPGWCLYDMVKCHTSAPLPQPLSSWECCASPAWVPSLTVAGGAEGAEMLCSCRWVLAWVAISETHVFLLWASRSPWPLWPFSSLWLHSSAVLVLLTVQVFPSAVDDTFWKPFPEIFTPLSSCV